MEASRDLLRELEDWYVRQCNGDWEHSYGVKVDTLDNPGWTVEIDLKGTDLERRAFREVTDSEPDFDWIRCWVEKEKFQAAGGPRMLRRILQTFLDWERSG